MSELINKQYLEKQFSGYSEVIKEQLNKKVDKTELENYYTSDKVDEIVENLSTGDVDLDGYAKTEDVNNALDLKADKTELFSGSYDDLTDKPTIPSTDGLATTEYVDNAVSNVTVDTSNLVTDEGLAATLSDYAKSADITEYDDTEVKESIKNLTDTKADKTELDAYVTDTELTDKGYATETFVTNKIAEAQLDGSEIDLTGLATKDELALKADKTEIPDVSGYALKTEIPSTDGLVTEENLSTTLADYVADEELSTALADYTTTSEADEKYVLDEEIEIIDLATLESMLGLSTEELEGLASLLSDQTIELSKTWSSSKIYSELNTTLDSAKQYTLDELSKAIGASYKVVTSVDQMTDSKVLYLLKDTDSGMYNIYVYDADTSTAELIGSFEINLDDYYTKTESEDLFATKADLVANYATKQEVVDGYATKTELQDAIADVEVEISETENNQIQTLEDGLFVDSETVTISKADYDALSDEEKNNGKTYFVPDDETTEDGTDLTQFAKVSDLEDGTITVGNSKKLNGLTKDELFAETNNKIKEINNNLQNKVDTNDTRLSDARTPTEHTHDDRYFTESEVNTLIQQVSSRLGSCLRYIGVYQQSITLAGNGEFFQAIPSEWQNGGYFYIANCSGNSLNFVANMENYNMAVKNLSSDTLSTTVQVYCFTLGV